MFRHVDTWGRKDVTKRERYDANLRAGAVCPVFVPGSVGRVPQKVSPDECPGYLEL